MSLKWCPCPHCSTRSGGITGGLRPYLLEHFDALRGFYADAAERHLVVVLWWD
ncbi:hypothetical protein [Streptomyces erythrochromogenes]|uniref:hypothetical protein n=1 Tax=Streptomyces erythrochromogenes TaxID=285574 RepID=UPI00380C083D